MKNSLYVVVITHMSRIVWVRSVEEIYSKSSHEENV